MAKARKNHQCTLCNLPIVVGTEYVRFEITPWECQEGDGFYTYKAHAECDKFWNEMREYWDNEYPPQGEFRKWLSERRQGVVVTNP